MAIMAFLILFFNQHYKCAMKKKLIFEKYEKNTQAFVGIVSDILDSGKNRLKSKDATRKKEVI